MQQQPSAQGIASLYRGNPQPLQQSIQKEQQAKPDLPPDLQKMLALQIVTNEKDSATAQKAMEQLQQMGGQQGTPPTVMQSLQQQAEQKLQAQAVQAQQKQQGLQALMQQAPATGVPEGTPQPEMQPEAQGIDQSDRVAFAGAEGGIVAFQSRGAVPQADEEEKYETPYDRMNRRNREAAAEAEKNSSDQPLDPQAAADRDALRRVLASLKGGSEDAGRAIADVATMVPRGLVGAYDTAVVRPMRAAGINAAYLSPKLTPAGASPESMTPFSDVKRVRDAAPPKGTMPAPGYTRGAMENDPRLATPPTQPVRDLAALARQKEQVGRPPAAAPVAQAAPVVAPPAAPAPESDAMKLQKARLTASPEDREAAAIAKYKQMVGEPDTAQHDRLIAELERRKQELAPKQGYEGLMEYLGEISRADSRGRGSFAAGAAGAARLNDLNKERSLQQFELSKQAIEVSQKKLDTVRAYAKDVYGIGKSAFDQVYKDQFEAAKEIVKDESAARQLAQQNTLKMLELSQQATLRREEMRSNEKVAGMRVSGAGAGDKQQLSELKALQTSLKDQLKDNRMIGKAGDPLRAQLAQVNMAIAQMAGLSTMGAAPGAAGPGGIPPDVQALLNKYGGK